MDALLAEEASLRWYLTILAFGGVALWETFRPRRELKSPLPRRWTMHLCLGFLSNAFAIWIFPAGAVITATLAQDNPYGLLNRDWLPTALVWALTLLLIDLSKYLQHWLLHRVPLFWRFHQVHHADPDYDLTTGLRFHPLEAPVSIGLPLLAVAVLAAPPAAVLVAELLGIGTMYWVHGNIRLPDKFERICRKALITPELHSIHHSDRYEEHNSNFGSVHPWWDQLFDTYRGEPLAGRDGMVLGLPGFQGPRSLRLAPMLILPFRRSKTR